MTFPLPTPLSILALLLALTAGVSDWLSERIPNWLTISAFVIGIIGNSWLRGWLGAKEALLGQDWL